MLVKDKPRDEVLVKPVEREAGTNDSIVPIHNCTFLNSNLEMFSYLLPIFLMPKIWSHGEGTVRLFAEPNHPPYEPTVVRMVTVLAIL